MVPVPVLEIGEVVAGPVGHVGQCVPHGLRVAAAHKHLDGRGLAAGVAASATWGNKIVNFKIVNKFH